MAASTTRVTRLMAAVLLLGGMSACAGYPAPPPADGIGFRQARSAEMAAMRDWRTCRDEALVLDEQARGQGNAGRYLAAARMLEKCEAGLGPEAAALAPEERMRAYGLAVLNYVKGGDMAAARRTLEAFRQAFTDRDLYYDDGSSFLDAMDLLVADGGKARSPELALANVGTPMRDELSRLRHWLAN
jgi:hypothetical protein